MQDRTVICIAASDVAESVTRLLEASGLQVVSTTNPAHSLALLFINRRTDTIVLDARVHECHQGLAPSLKALRPDVRLVLVAVDQFASPPDLADCCVSLASGTDALLSALSYSEASAAA